MRGKAGTDQISRGRDLGTVTLASDAGERGGAPTNRSFVGRPRERALWTRWRNNGEKARQIRTARVVATGGRAAGHAAVGQSGRRGRNLLIAAIGTAAAAATAAATTREREADG
jgi:hypothetical protein